MKNKTKKFLTIMLCFAIAFTTIPLSAFAAYTDTTDYYCKIKIKEGYKKNLKPGDTIEVFVDYYVGDAKDINIIWSVNGDMCEYEFVTDKENGLVTGLTITCISGGMFYAFARIFDSNGKELADNHVEIWCEAPDNRPLNEKINEFINMLPANLSFLGYCFEYIFSIVTVGPVTSFIETCIVIHNRLHELIDFISNLKYCS